MLSNFQEYLVEEVAILKHIQHPNIIQLLGVCMQKSTSFIITEYMPYGNLEMFFQGPNGKHLSFDILENMAQQICSAMIYLESHKIIHRYL